MNPPRDRKIPVLTDGNDILLARQCGLVRCLLVSGRTDDMAQVLAGFGLYPTPEALVEHDHETAYLILRDLLWKDMAYGHECMPKETAEFLATRIFRQHACASSRFFSNGSRARRESWTPLTESTFDSGLIIVDPGGRRFCVWFQDED